MVESAMDGRAGHTTAQAAPRVLFYCHDSIGLGHLRRAYLLAETFRARWPAAAQLVVTGLGGAHHLPCPDGVDYVKLPTVHFMGRGGGAPERRSQLTLALSETHALRQTLLLAIARRFRPDVLLVDHMPSGIGGELVPTLQYLKGAEGKARLIFGLRDVVEEAARVREMWSKHGGYELLERLYDLILVYGTPHVWDLAREAGFTPASAAKVRYAGYLRRPAGARSREQIRAELRLGTDRLVLVTAGGGADGYPVLRAALEALAVCPAEDRFDCMLVSGPLMPEGERERLKGLLPAGSPARLIDSVANMADYVAAADVVVARAGYNTVCEILSFARPAILIPRATFGSAASREQVIRAQAMQARGLARMLHPDELTPARLLGEIRELLRCPSPPQVPLDMDGLPAATAAIEQLLARSRD
jgi:predicted glycosyltransferase